MRNGRKRSEGALSGRRSRVVKADVKLPLLLVALKKVPVDAVTGTVLCHDALASQSQRRTGNKP